MQMADWIELLPRLLLMMLVASPPAIIGFIVMRRGRSWVFFALGLVSTALLLAIALPSIRPARPMAERNTCIANLRLVDSTVQQWALENKKASTDTYSLSDTVLIGYFKGSALPYCPGGGSYVAGSAVSLVPTCSLSGLGHTL